MSVTLSQDDYKEFFRRYPDQRNPTDLNTKEKFRYAMEIGFERYRAMQADRKASKGFTSPDWWRKS